MRLAHSLTVFDARFERQTSDLLENNIKYTNKKKACIDLLAFRQGRPVRAIRTRATLNRLNGRTVLTVI